MGERHQCCQRIHLSARLGSKRCVKPAVVEVDGQWWCAIHTPAAKDARWEKRTAKWAAERQAKDAAAARASALQCARDAVVEAAKGLRKAHKARGTEPITPEWASSVFAARQNLDAATDALIALEEQT